MADNTTLNLGSGGNIIRTEDRSNVHTCVTMIDKGALGGAESIVVAGNGLPVAVESIAAGTNNIGDVDVASIAAGSNLVGDVGIQGRTTGGLSIFRSIDLDESEEEVKATAGTVYSIIAINLHTAPLYLKLYNDTAANVTVGTTTPVLTIPLPAQADSNGGGFVMAVPQGIAFGAAISAAVTTGVADNNTGAPAANMAVVNILYK